ncbi:MAG: hypothetical protein JSV56_01405 [Methanomassiliicoccales archaeon]|nr:MAG: hypothetical protein JSV56_01405 [Methanomassiliicoccales archaeon]
MEKKPSNSIGKGKKPWERETTNNLVIVIGLFLLFIQPAAFIPWYYTYIFHIVLTIGPMSLGIVFFRTLFKHWSAMKDKKIDRIGYCFIGIIFEVYGILYFIWLLNFFPIFSTWDPIPGMALMAVFYSLTFPAVTCIFFLYLAITILRKNHQSSITRLIFLSFTSLGISWFFFIIYYSISLGTWEFSGSLTSNVQTAQLNYDSYLVFYLFIFFGLLSMVYGCQKLIFSRITQLQRNIYLLMGVSFFCSIILILMQNDVGFAHSYLFGLTYLTSTLGPIGYSLYILGSYPDWITLERGRWIKRIRIGILLFTPYPLVEVVVGLIPLAHIFLVPIHPNAGFPQFVTFLSLPILCTFYSGAIIYSGLPDVNKWFFEEIKFRASPEVRDFDPNVNLASLWELVDEWQEKSQLTPKEMTSQKLEEYVQVAVANWKLLGLKEI